MFNSGAVCKILGINRSRLQNLLKYSHGRLKPSKSGHGYGTVDYFRTEAIYGMTIALFLYDDGFAPGFIGRVLEEITDDFFRFDQHGQVSLPLLAFSRVGEERRIAAVSRKRPPAVGLSSPVYYLLDPASITAMIDRKIGEIRRAVPSSSEANREEKTPRK
jgi:hypothetical protein